jgi:hypothetical protein
MGSTRTSILEILRNANSSVSALRSCGTARDGVARAFPLANAVTAELGAIGNLLLRHAGERARCAQHAAGYFNNRHVGIFGAAQIRVNVRIFYQSVDTADRAWPTSIAPQRVSFRSGSAWLGRSQKDGLPPRPGLREHSSVQGHQLALEGAAWSLPLSNRERGMEVKRTRDLVLLAAPSLLCALFGLVATLFGVPSFLLSAEARFSVRP